MKQTFCPKTWQKNSAENFDKAIIQLALVRYEVIIVNWLLITHIQILPTSAITDIWRILRRIYILKLGLKRLINLNA